MKKILLVEDDPQILKSLSMSLRYSGFEVAIAESVQQGWEKIPSGEFDLILLDVNLPDGTGIDLCRKVREAGNETPVLFLSARTDEETVVESMNIGGDDYIRKPFGTEELKVRMGKLLKRSVPKRDVIQAGPLTLDVAKRLATLKGENLSLGRREFDILSILAKRPGDVISRDAIQSHFEEAADVNDRTIDSHMSHLRKKMRGLVGDIMRIHSVYGVGYRLEWQEES